jgi:hypothetical protein
MPRLALLLLVFLAAIPAAAQSDNRNAATWYNRAFERLGTISESEWELIKAWDADPSGAPSQELRDILAKAGPMLNDVRRASQQEFADHALDYSRGYEMLLTHLSPIFRQLAPLMQADGLVRLHDGDTAGAADRVASLYRVSEQFTSDRTLISSLVGQATFRLADQTGQAGFDRAAFNASDAEAMLRALQRMELRDPFNMVEAVIGEQEIGVSWLADTLATQEQRLNSQGWAMILAETEEDAQRIVSMTDDEFTDSLGQYDLLLGDVVEAFSNEDRAAGRAQLEQLQQEMDAGEHGLLAECMEPWFLRIFDQMVESEQQVAARIEMLEGLVTGEVKPEEEANAAIFYVRGIEALRKIAPERLAVISDFDAGRVGTLDDATRTTLIEAASIVDLFREGSLKKRCDFTFLRPGREPQFCADYVGGMRDTMRLLHADAIRLLREGESDDAADRLAICYRVVAHLAGDELLLTALLTHRVFQRTNEIALRALDAEVLTAAHRDLLVRASQRIGRKDPFGCIGSLLDTRRRLVREVDRGIVGEAETMEQRRAMVKMVEQWDGDQLLYYLAIRDTMLRAGQDEGAGTAGNIDPISRLDDVISLVRLDQARTEVSRVAPILASGGIDVFGDHDFPRFGHFADRMRAARGDLRAGLAALRPPVTPAPVEEGEE